MCIYDKTKTEEIHQFLKRYHRQLEKNCPDLRSWLHKARQKNGAIPFHLHDILPSVSVFFLYTVSNCTLVIMKCFKNYLYQLSGQTTMEEIDLFASACAGGIQEQVWVHDWSGWGNQRHGCGLQIWHLRPGNRLCRLPSQVPFLSQHMKNVINVSKYSTGSWWSCFSWTHSNILQIFSLFIVSAIIISSWILVWRHFSVHVSKLFYQKNLHQEL